MIKDYSAMTTTFGYQTLMTSDSGFYSIIMTILSLAIMVITKPWILSEKIIHGLVSALTSRTIVSHAQLALDPRHHDTDHMVISDNSLFLRNHGIRSPWISL